MRQHLITLLFTALAAYLSGCSNGMPAAANVHNAELPMVAVAPVTRSSIAASTEMTAEFQPFQEVDVMAKVAGFVKTIRVDLGDRVRDGQLLAELEAPEMNDDILRANAVVEQSTAEVLTAGDELKRAESSREIARLSFARIEDAAKREPGLVPRQEFDEARARDQIAQAQVAAAKSRLRVAEQKIQVAKAEESRLRTMRNYVTITAPFSGVVTKRYANVGSMLQSTTTPLVRLSQVSVLRLSLPVPESLVPAVKIGLPATVQVKSLGRSFEGRVARFAGRVDSATRTMITEVDVQNPQGVMMPGMYATVALQSASRADVLAAPLGALERNASGSRVYRVDASGTVQIAPVEVGIEDAKRAEVVKGAAEGDLLIVGSKAGLKNGDKVRTKVVDTL